MKKYRNEIYTIIYIGGSLRGEVAVKLTNLYLVVPRGEYLWDV